jgi:hypothetical protein
VRRILLASAIGLFTADSAASATSGLVLSLFGNFIVTELKPFKNGDDNKLGIVFSYSLTTLFLSALLIKVDASTDDERQQQVVCV